MMAIVPEDHDFPFPGLREDSLTHINLATAYYRRGDFDRSVSEWEIVRRSSAGDPYPVFSLGMVRLRQGRAREAESYAMEALGLDARCAFAEDVLGLAYFEQGRTLEALEALGRALRLAPKAKFIRAHYLQVRAAYIENAGRNTNQDEGDSI